MFELLYAVSVVVKSFGLPGLCMLPMAIEWRMAHWVPLRMADGTGCDKALATSFKNAQSVPGEYIDELLLLCATPRSLSPPVRRLSLSGSRKSVMSCIEICESPIQDHSDASLVKGRLEDPQADGTAGYVSDESVRFATVSFQDTDILIVLYESIRIRTPPSKLTLMAKAKTTTDSNIAGRTHTIANDSR